MQFRGDSDATQTISFPALASRAIIAIGKRDDDRKRGGDRPVIGPAVVNNNRQ